MMTGVVVDLTHSDEEEEEEVDNLGHKIGRNYKIKCSKKSKGMAQATTSSSDEDDCMVLDGDPDKAVEADDDSEAVDESEELFVVGEKGQVACRDYPHPRHLCAKFPFTSTPHEMHCKQCHCYVCDSLAPCLYWGTGHCDVTEKSESGKDGRNCLNNNHQGSVPVPEPATSTQSPDPIQTNQVPTSAPLESVHVPLAWVQRTASIRACSRATKTTSTNSRATKTTGTASSTAAKTARTNSTGTNSTATKATPTKATGTNSTATKFGIPDISAQRKKRSVLYQSRYNSSASDLPRKTFRDILQFSPRIGKHNFGDVDPGFKSPPATLKKRNSAALEKLYNQKFDPFKLEQYIWSKYKHKHGKMNSGSSPFGLGFQAEKQTSSFTGFQAGTQTPKFTGARATNLSRATPSSQNTWQPPPGNSQVKDATALSKESSSLAGIDYLHSIESDWTSDL